jgi:RimJ/RimL family protein N-acetyltransferase
LRADGDASTAKNTTRRSGLSLRSYVIALAVIECESGRIIGTSRYYGYDPARREVMIGYTFLERRFWGGDCNQELKSLMLNHAFRFVDRVLFEVGANNVRPQKALEKIGARLCGKKEVPARDGAMLPCLVLIAGRGIAIGTEQPLAF